MLKTACAARRRERIQKAMLQLYNSMAREKEPFAVRNDRVGVFACGIIPIDSPDLGHAFTFVHFDVLVRYLRHLGYRVMYVQSLADVLDGIPDTAKTENVDWYDISERNPYRFLSDMHWLGNLAPTFFPRVGDLIPDLIEHIQKLLDGGWAYQANGNVYFEVASFKPFGRLGKLPKRDWLPAANRQGNHPDDPRKKNPLDFVLWRAGRPGEPVWNSPWGEGRPGWHVECSPAATKFLGHPIDIVGGSVDLIFPHHECSAALSECITGGDFSRFYVYTGLVKAQGRKMRGEFGNTILLQDLRHMSNLAVRIGILDQHYGRPWNFDSRDFRIGGETEELFRQACLKTEKGGVVIDSDRFESRFYEAMNDDLDTPRALGILRQTAIEIMRDRAQDAEKAKLFLCRALRVLGLETNPAPPENSTIV